MFRLVDEQWDKQFAQASRKGTDSLRIICPYIKEGALNRLLRRKPREIQVITRFNLTDFATGVSDIIALRRLLDAGATIRGVKNLHAKLYLFGESRAIITSANLTEAAMRRNHELGTVSDDVTLMKKCHAYFESLWERAGSDLQGERLNNWHQKVTLYQVRGGRPNDAVGLDDFGVEAGIVKAPPDKLPLVVAETSQAFVKLLGSGDNRSLPSIHALEEIKGSGCHWAVSYPARRRPISVRDGDVIFMGRLTEDPNDIRVFGRAIGMAYQEGRDDATGSDIERRSWKERWARYIRVHSAEFVDGTLADGVSLNEMMDALEENSVASTQRNAARGEGNTNPRRSYSQQPAIKLSAEGILWLGERLQGAFERHGKVSQEELDELDWPDSSNIPLVTE